MCANLYIYVERLLGVGGTAAGSVIKRNVVGWEGKCGGK